MPGDLEHIDVGPRLTKVAWELGAAHRLADQAVGDVIYASTAAQLTGLGIGPAGAPLVVDDAGSIPVWSTRLLHTAGLFAFQEATEIDILGGDILFTERADPAAPAANKAVLYSKDNGGGKTQIVARFPTGAVQVIATEP